MTDDSAFKKQVRNRMTATGEKYTEAHRKIIEAREAEAAENVAIQDAVRRSIVRAIGLSAVEIDRAESQVHVTIRAARPDVAWGFVRDPNTEGPWRELAADQLRSDLEEATGKRVRLDIRTDTPSD
jgi:ribosomal protein S3